MKKLILILAAALFSTAIFAQETNSISEQIELKYTAAIEGRTTEILKVLALSDTNQRQKVHDLIIAQYRALNTWHDENDAKVQAARADTNATAQIRASLKSLHDGFVSGLADNLTPEQIEKVKDKLTYGKVQFTFAGYLAQYPDLSAANRQKILELLKQAREEAMDGGSAAQKTAVFTRYKGRINNFLSQQGIHPTKPKAAPATNSVAQ